MSSTTRPVVVLGMMAKVPVPGVIWQTLHYLLGFRALGLEPYYVEAHRRLPAMLMSDEGDDASALAASLIAAVLRPVGLGTRWAYRGHDDAAHGLDETALARVLRDAELIVNLHGGTPPPDEDPARGRLVYLETDPVALQVELHDGVERSIDVLERHSALFTFAENLAKPGCTLPVCERFDFRPTRQPVVLDLWTGRDAAGPGELFTTVGNWRQPRRRVTFEGRVYGWSKDDEWRRFIDLPRRTAQPFELALSGAQLHHVEALEARGWRVRSALAFGTDLGAYRDYITGSRGEFTVAKEQNVAFRTGWFSDRGATYLAAGRPVVMQDTGFGDVLPCGEGLFAVADAEQAAAAVETINGDYERHRRAAAQVAREHFDAGRVLGALLDDLGLRRSGRAVAPGASAEPAAAAPAAAAAAGPPIGPGSSVLALIPHYKCEEWLEDCLDSLVGQTRPPDAIVVIDDASDEPPLSTVQRFESVTLLHAERNVGPYRLVQQVIDETDYDAYLFQDADDWSAPERVERLLAAGAQTGAELIGTQEIRVFCEEPEVIPIAWPLDVEAQFAEKVTAFPLLHPTSIVSAALLRRVGGFAPGLRFSGDAEFLRRARHVARIVNIPYPGYVRRIRAGSLTTARETGLQSPERKRVMEMLWAQARRNAELVEAGREPDLSPIATAPPVGLRHLAGPALTGARRAPAPAVASPAVPRATGAAAAPIFVVGAERSGASALAAALGEHPALAYVPDGAWDAAPEGGDLASLTALLERLGPRWVDGSWGRTLEIERLAAAFPGASFVHIVRDVDAAVAAVVDPPLGTAGATGGTQIPARLKRKAGGPEAIEAWTAATQACVDAHAALGPERVLRVAYDDLVAAPESVLRRCLQFAGEPYERRCLRPLRALSARPAGTMAPLDHSPALARARALSAALLQRPEPVAEAEPEAEAGAPATPRRMVLVTDHFPKFSETFFLREFAGLLARGWDAHVLCNRSNREQWEYFPDERADLQASGRIQPITDFDAQLRELAPDLVHFGYGTLARGRLHVPRALGAKIVVSFRGYDINYFGLEDPHCYDEVWESADMLHLVSEDVWRRAQRRGCPPGQPHRVITDAVDIARFAPAEHRGGVLGGADAPLEILGIGRLHWKKGWEYGLAALRGLLDRGVYARLRILGEGPQRESIAFAIHDLGLEDHVELPGACSAEAVRAALAGADVVLHPAVSEGFCVSVIEAQATAAPVVASDADGLSENVADGVTGYVVARRDVAALTDRLATLAADGERRQRMGAAARQRAELHFDAERQLDALEALYEEVLAAAPQAQAEAQAGLAPDAANGSDATLTTLRAELESLDARRAGLDRQIRARVAIDRVQAFVAERLPRRAKVIVVSRGDEELVDLDDREGWHYPQVDGGIYSGHHPADGAAAIRELEALRERGGEYLVIPATSAWWLDFYDELRRHLERRYTRLAEDPDGYVAFALDGQEVTA